MLSIRTSRYLAMAMLLMGLLLTACSTRQPGLPA